MKYLITIYIIINYLGTNLMKDMQDVYIENYKCCQEKVKKT